MNQTDNFGMRAHLLRCSVMFSLLTPAFAQGAADRDGDGDGLSDFHEVHKYRTDPDRKDSDGDGIPDGDWRERREFQYTVRTVVQVMRPVTIEYLCDDHQDARVLDETATHVELEVIHYPFTTVATTIRGDKNWRQTRNQQKRWLEAGPTSDCGNGLGKRIRDEMTRAGLQLGGLDDKALVELASRWLCERAKHQDSFTTFVTAFDKQGQPFIPKELRERVAHSDETLQYQWPRDLKASGMFEHKTRGSCTSSATYLSGCLRALGIPTRTVLTIPLVDANDERELELVERGLTHHELKDRVLPALKRLRGSWASHTFNEVWVGGRWRRLNYSRLGQDIVDENLFGMITHVATFHDWADARMPETVGKRQTLRHYSDTFGGPNPYSTIALRDEFGVHCKIANPAPKPIQVTVAEAIWGHSERAPEDIRDYFVKRNMYGLIARCVGPRSLREMNRFLEGADLRVYLEANGQPTLGVGFEPGAQWVRDDHVWIAVPFGPTDRQQHDRSKSYRFVCRNEKKTTRWQVDASVTVAPRPQ